MTADSPRHVAAPEGGPPDGLAARDGERARELSAIYQNVPGILFYIAVEPDGEFRFVSMSQAGLIATGLRPEQIVGALVRDVIPPPSRDLVLDHYRDAIRSGRTVQWREVSVYPAGRRIGEVAVTPLCDARGVVTHLIGIVHDITDREHLEEALHQREERLSFLLRLNDAVRPLNDPGEIQDVTVRLLGEHLRANRVIYATIEGDEFVVRRSYVHGVVAPPDRGPIGSSGAVVLEAYRRGDTVAVNDVTTDPRFTEADRARLLENEIVAFVSMVLYKESRWLAAFGVSHAAPRTWTQDEIALIEETGERMWAAAERARAVTALRLAHTELQESEERFAIIHDRAPFAISLTSVPDGRIVTVNEAFEQLFEFSREEVRGRTRVELGISTPALNAVLVEELERTGQVRDLEVRRRTKSGGECTLQLTIDPVNIANRPYLLTTVVDVTEKRRAEAALRTSEHLLRLSLQAARMGTWRYDLITRIFRGDKVWKGLHGFGGDIPIDTLEDASRGLHPDDVQGFQLRINQATEDGTQQYEYRVVSASGETRWIASQWMRVPETSSLVGVVQDVTERKQSELMLQHRNRDQERALEHRTLQLRQLASDLTLAELQAREQLAKTLHDGLQQLLVSAALNLDREVKRDPERVTGSSDPLMQAKHHLDDAIAAARSLSVELSPPLLHGSGLPAALAWLAERTLNEYGLAVRVSADPRANSLRKDVRALLFESVRELLFNAVKHAKVDRVTLDLALGEGDTLCITVSDQGIGFDPATLFDRAKAGQAGWGLFRIRERLTLLGGRFEVDSAPARGARFRLVAPRGAARSAADTQSSLRPVASVLTAPESAHGRPVRALTILIVDDHAGVRRVFRELLEERPELHVVGEAANGREAIVEAHLLRPDVILMDVSMPEMDGITATRQLRAELPSIQILGLSTQPRELDRHPIEDAGATDFFTKGVDTQRLIDHLLAVHLDSVLGLPSQSA